jgi:hypothetical protein
MNILPSMRKFLFCLCVSLLAACSENGGIMATNLPPAPPPASMAGKPASPMAGSTSTPAGAAGTGTVASPIMATGAAGTTTITPPAGAAGMIASVAGMAAPAAGSGTTSAAGSGTPAAGSGATGGSAAAAGGAGGSSAGASSFTRVYEEVFVPVGCGAAGACHRGPGGGKLDLTDKATSFKSLVGVMAMGMSAPTPPTPNCSESGLMRVKAGDPANSLLVSKLESTMPKCGQQMPPGGPVDAGQLKLVKDWIMAGAKDD